MLYCYQILNKGILTKVSRIIDVSQLKFVKNFNVKHFLRTIDCRQFFESMFLQVFVSLHELHVKGGHGTTK